MKYIFILALALTALPAAAQQRNTCVLFIDAYNEGSKGFPSFKSNPDDTSSIYEISKDSLAIFGLSSGMILNYLPLISQKNPQYRYKYWVLVLTGPRQFVSDKSWDELKETIQASFEQLCKTFGQVCFSGLKMSELCYGKDDKDRQLLNYYFYPKELELPAGLNREEVETMLQEEPYIHFSLNQPFIGKGYQMTYSVRGIRYIKP